MTDSVPELSEPAVAVAGSFPEAMKDFAAEGRGGPDDDTWVRNIRAAGGDAVIRHRTREAVHLHVVPAGQRPPILKRYLELGPGARPHIPVDPAAPLSEFERIAADYPVFRISAAAASPQPQPPRSAAPGKG